MFINTSKILIITILTNMCLNQEIQCMKDSDCPTAWSCITESKQQQVLAPTKIRNQDLNSNQPICIHDYVNEMRAVDYIGLLLIFVLCIIAIAGGVGGGFIQIVVQLFVFGFNTTQGTPLVQVTVFSASSTKFILDIRSSHPMDEHKSLICWDIVVCSLPMILMGNIIGLMANIIFPDWLILTIFIAVVIKDLIAVTNKYIKITSKPIEQKDEDKQTLDVKETIRKESHLYNRKESNINVDDDEDDAQDEKEMEEYNVNKDKTRDDNIITAKPEEPTTKNNTDSEKTPATNVTTKTTDPNAAEPEFKDDQNKYPLTTSKVILMASTLLLSILTTVLRGSNKNASLIGLKFCDFYSWLLFGLYLILDFLLILCASHILRSQEEPSIISNSDDKITLEDHEGESDRLYSQDTLGNLNLLMLQCGIVAGLLGIGGGLLIGPLLLNLLKLRPEVQGATTNVIVLSAVLSGTLYLFIMGTLQLDWGIILGLLSISSALISKFLFKEVEKYLGQSVFVLALVVIIGLAAVSSPILTALRVLDAQQREGTSVLVMQDLCGL